MLFQCLVTERTNNIEIKGDINCDKNCGWGKIYNSVKVCCMSISKTLKSDLRDVQEIEKCNIIFSLGF
jgi:hypothetical protein